MAFQFPTFIEQGEAALAAFERNKGRKDFPDQQPATAGGFRLTQGINRAPITLFQHGAIDGANPTNAKIIAVVLADYFSKANSYSWPSRAELEDLTGVKARGIRSGIATLQNCGLFGVVQGDGNFNTRYYPLMHSGSRKAFIEIIEQAKRGVNPHVNPAPVASPSKPARQSVFPQ